jgi:hypothetical protein
MAERERMDDEELKALIAQEIQSSVSFTEAELSGERARALEYYRGEMKDTPAADNRSSVVSRDVADTIGWMLPGIIRVFSASDRMAEYEPYGPNDEEFAKQATDYCNYVFWKDNPGYRTLWDATHDSLLLGNGIVKHWWDDKEECEYSEMSGLTAEQIAILQQDQGVEVTAQKPGEPQIVMMPDPQTGQLVQQQIPVFDVKMKRVTRAGRLRIKCIAGEDFLKDRDSISIEDARFTAHRNEVTRSDLIEMGFDKAEVDELPAYRHSGLQEERQARDPNFDVTSDTQDKAMQLIELYECYLKVDIDGDGIAETVRAYYAGSGGSGQMLDWEVWDDDVPFSDIPCEPVPHRWDARSIADETMDTQRVKTVLTRQFLDNLYWVNNPLTEVEEGSVVNSEMMNSPVFGGTVWRKKGTMGTAPITPLPIPFIGDKALMGLEHFDQVTEKRTGVSRSTMALDPETLQNQSATANQNQRDASYSQVELIARNQAELGWKRVFKMILRLLVKHQDRPRTIRIRDKWVDMDPRYWNANMDVTINVGLGTGSRDRDMMMLNNILLTQNQMALQLAQGGFAAQALDMLPKIIKTATKLAESSGIRNPDEYYIQIDPQTLDQMKQQATQQKPDPALQLEQAKVQAQMQLEQQKMQMSAQLEQEKAAAAVQKEQAQMQADLQVKSAELQKNSETEAQKQQLEYTRLAEDSRQRELDRQHQMQIEMMKIEAQQQMHRESAMLTAHTNEQNNQVKVQTAKQKAPAK